MAIIHASIEKQHYETVLSSATNTYVADEPLSAGGTDKGFSPSELLASALATCTCVTLRMYADRKQWPLTGVRVKVEFTRDAEQNVSNISRDISLDGALTAEQHERLLSIANSCFIHKTLSNPINITTTLIS